MTALHTTAAAPAQRRATSAATALRRNVRADVRKLTTVRSTTVLLALTAGVGLVVTWAAARFVEEEVMTVAGLFTFSVVFTAVFAAVGGILAITTEVQHGTLGPTLVAVPSWRVVVGSKVLVVAGLGILLGVAGGLSGAVGAALGGVPVGDTSDVGVLALSSVTFTGLTALLGLGIGLVARHGTAAISGLLVWWLVVENLLTVVLDPMLARFMPFYAGNALVGIAPEDAASTAAALSRPQGALVLSIYATFALLAGAVALRRRDHG